MKPSRSPQPEIPQLGLNQRLGGLGQVLLHLADADRPQALAGLPGLSQRVLNQQAAEEMRLARTSSAVGPLVSRRSKQRLEHGRCLNSEGPH